MSVLYSDDYLALSPPSSSGQICPKTQQFFRIVKQLPLELQGILCLRVYGEKKDFIPGKYIDNSFREVIKMVHSGNKEVVPDWWRSMRSDAD